MIRGLYPVSKTEIVMLWKKRQEFQILQDGALGTGRLFACSGRIEDYSIRKYFVVLDLSMKAQDALLLRV